MIRPLLAVVALGSLLSLSVGGLGCSAPVADDGAMSNESALTETDQAGIDAQVLQVWTPGRLFPRAAQPWQSPRPTDVAIDATTGCATLESRSWSHWVDDSVDCTQALGAAAPFDVTHAAGPVMSPVRFTVSRDQNGSGIQVDPDFCDRIELRVVVREAAATQPSFAGVGFWSSRGDTFTAKDALQEVGRVTLANHEPAIVYRFTGISTCISSAHNSTSGNMFQTFAFKPYAAFDVAPPDGETKRYRVWERMTGNHTIGHSWPGSTPRVDATAFDRQGELLAH